MNYLVVLSAIAISLIIFTKLISLEETSKDIKLALVFTLLDRPRVERSENSSMQVFSC
jgi:hypothetical protein